MARVLMCNVLSYFSLSYHSPFSFLSIFINMNQEKSQVDIAVEQCDHSPPTLSSTPALQVNDSVLRSVDRRILFARCTDFWRKTH